MEKKDRAKYYKEPMTFLNEYVFDSEVLEKIQHEHWKSFHDKSQTDDGYKIGDFINASVRLTANQIADIIEEFIKLKSMKAVKAKASEILNEIYTQIEENK